MDTTTATPAVLPPAIPLTHQNHPFWHIDWAKVLPIALQTLQAAATLAPVVVAITDKKDPEGVAEATQLSGLAGSVLGQVRAALP